jgi:hypothetical protein
MKSTPRTIDRPATRSAWRISSAIACFVLAHSPVLADGPADNQPTSVRRVPKLGVEVPAEVRAELEAGLKSLDAKIDAIRWRKDPKMVKLLPDVEIYRKAVRDALDYQEFFDAKEFAIARKLLEQGHDRAVGLEIGNPAWTRAKGLVVRGYRSKIDGSVQPVGLVIPDTYDGNLPGRYRTDLWFHGRGETLSELTFVHQRQTQPGQFTPADTIVIHPYGRYCNAAKLAGEVDAWEALELVKDQYRVDEDRISVRGFSMGGASAWHFAAHHPTSFFATNPGAGFSETPRFLKDFQHEIVQPTWWERKLFQIYDCNEWAENFRLIPTVAYSGEIDNQKQAADVMAEALDKIGIDLTHIIGPKTGHKYEPEAAAEVERRMANLARKGRVRVPGEVNFVTYTLRYPQAAWLKIEGLGEHWAKAEISGRIDTEEDIIRIKTKNVTAFKINFDAGEFPYDTAPKVVIDDLPLQGDSISSDRSWAMSFVKIGDTWKDATSPESKEKVKPIRKIPGLQGPIDDAFLDSFLFVLPSGTADSPKVDEWSKAEAERARVQWRQHFRGVAPTKLDTEVTIDDIRTKNLILWGDEKSNAFIAKIAGRLPIKSKNGKLQIGEQSFDSVDHAPILIYPNPENPAKYVVINSGFTFREYAHLNNARQIPKLPDWAIVDLNTPPDSLWPGKIVAADFFDESWHVKPSANPSNRAGE